MTNRSVGYALAGLGLISYMLTLWISGDLLVVAPTGPTLDDMIDVAVLQRLRPNPDAEPADSLASVAISLAGRGFYEPLNDTGRFDPAAIINRRSRSRARHLC